MKMNFLFLLMTILGVFFLIKPSDVTKKSSLHIDKTRQEYMKNLLTTTYTESGMLKNKIYAAYWAYLPLQQQSTLIAPHMIHFKPDGTEWHITAKHGLTKQPTLGGIEEIELWDKVCLERMVNTNNAPILVETEKLCYHPKKQFAESENTITMTKPDGQVTGTGLRAFLEKNSVELLHNVKTYYDTTYN
jgi:LPS export ABC transporter protein LptC